MSQWYAVRVMTRREKSAHDGLTEQGFAVFMPCETVLRKICREIEPVSRPLFPGYLFVLCGHEDFRQVLETSGVFQFVRYIEAGVASPVVIPLAAVIEMQAAERAGRYDRTRKKIKPNAYRPKKGQKVQIVAGPWMSYVGKLLSTPRGKRAQVMIEGPFGRGVTLDVDHLRAA